jgi:hypothetical protein
MQFKRIDWIVIVLSLYCLWCSFYSQYYTKSQIKKKTTAWKWPFEPMLSWTVGVIISRFLAGDLITAYHSGVPGSTLDWFSVGMFVLLIFQIYFFSLCVVPNLTCLWIDHSWFPPSVLPNVCWFHGQHVTMSFCHFTIVYTKKCIYVHIRYFLLFLH